jgi:hypothetical protein
MLSTRPRGGSSAASRSDADGGGRALGIMAAFAAPALLAACASEPEIVWVPTYCYRTLADVECRTAPDPGREGRLVGVQLTAEGDPATARYWLGRHAARDPDEPRIEASEAELDAWRGTPVPESGCRSVPCKVVGAAVDTALGLVPVSPILAAF